MDFNKSDFQILQCLIKTESTNPIQSLTLPQIAKHTGLSISKLRLVMKTFLILDYVGNGAKDHISKTYFLKESGRNFYNETIGNTDNEGE